MLATLFMGILTGSYIYFINHTGDSLVEVRELAETNEFMVIGELYGGCMRGGVCASYRITSDGTYTYIGPNDEGELGDRVSGTISEKDLGRLKELVSSTDLSTIVSSTFGGTCPITYDGVAMRYDITLEGENYGIDTCLDETGDEPLFDELQGYFVEFERVHSED